MTMNCSRRGLALFAMLLCLTQACGRSGEEAPPEETAAFEQAYENGELKVTARLSRSAIKLVETTELTLEATAPEGKEVDFPNPGQNLGEFTVVKTVDDDPRLVADNRILHRRTYALEPFLPGEYALPEMEVSIAAPVGEERSSIKTDKIALTVESVLDEQTGAEQIKEIAEPVDLPRETNWWLIAGIVAALAALAWVLYGAWKRRQERLGAPPPLLPPHEIALRALKNLLAADLLQKGEIKLFYSELTGILRHYIEERFGLRAPEQTTEEFLEALRQSDQLAADHKELLKAFLVHCDLVKFAEVRPQTAEIQNSINLCRNFIEATKPEPPKPEGQKETASATRAVGGQDRAEN